MGKRREAKEKNCKALYEEWKELEKRTAMEVFDLRHSDKIKAKYINPKDLTKIREVERRLFKECSEFLSPSERLELEHYKDFDAKEN